jgi:hypothetical protein
VTGLPASAADRARERLNRPSDHPRHTIRLAEPQVGTHEVEFRWEVDPPTELYERTAFRLEFGPELDLRRVPAGLWWRILLLCLHTHWALLRPCRIELPVRVAAAEREFWQRLVENAAVQIEAYGSMARPGPVAEIVGSGPMLPPAVPLSRPAEAGSAVVAFSGGKDSLVLSALLAELGEAPVLVTVTSPVPWARDHVGVARDRARAQTAQRLGVQTFEVKSDFRTSWLLSFAARDGCRLGVHELSDLPLYHAAMAAVAAMLGIGSVFVASEADLQYNGARDGIVILHPEFLSCAVTQSALDALWRPHGIRQASLTYPLHMPQVQGLLLRRYSRLADLQCSCWRAPPGERACNTCVKCFLSTLVALSEGVSPRVVGPDPVAVLCAYGDWSLDAPGSHGAPTLHESRSARHHVVRCLQAVSTDAVQTIIGSPGAAGSDPRVGEALAAYARLRADALTRVVPRAPGYVGGLLGFVAPDLREPLRRVLDRHFEPAAEGEFAGIVSRARGLSRWITEPLR